MLTRADLAAARAEVISVKSECIDLILKVDAQVAGAAGSAAAEVIRLMAVPIIYSAWERMFRLGTGVCIGILRRQKEAGKKYSANQQALWLLRTDFFKSFSDKIRNHDKSVLLVGKFVDEFEKWSKSPLETITDASALVITGSNVNGDVVELNAQIIGLDKTRNFAQLSLGRLHDLVGVRNDIGHGGSIKPPGERQLSDLTTYTKELVDGYSDVLEKWITGLGRGVRV